jgi:hypothetical protein
LATKIFFKIFFLKGFKMGTLKQPRPTKPGRLGGAVKTSASCPWAASPSAPAANPKIETLNFFHEKVKGQSRILQTKRSWHSLT